MAKVVDLRNSDGSIVFLGKSLTLPSNDATGDVEFCGSLRYNPQTKGIEAYLPKVVSTVLTYSFRELCLVENVYADIAERYESDAIYDSGTVLIIGGENEVTTTNIPYSNKVAGIVSTNPAFKMNSYAGNDNTHPYLALTGRVPCKVVGNVSKGDLLVTSDVSGYAQASDRELSPGMLIGIALGDFIGDRGIVEVKV